jgi:hypothetical protein
MFVTLLTFHPLIEGLPPLLNVDVANIANIFVTPLTFQLPMSLLKFVFLNILDILTTLLVSQLLTPLIVVIELQLKNIAVVAVIPTKFGVSVTPVNTKLVHPENIVIFESLIPRKGPNFKTSLNTSAEDGEISDVLNPVTVPLIVIV